MKRHVMLVALAATMIVPATITQAAETSAENQNTTRLILSGSGTAQAQPDQLKAHFRIESRNSTAAAAQKAVNTLVHDAIEQAKKNKGITYTVQNYDVSEWRDDKIKNKSTWSASQTLTLVSADSDELLPLTGQLQSNGLLLEGLEWSLSPEKQNTLLLEAKKNAVTDLQKQSDTLAQALKMHVVRFERISLSDTPFPRPLIMAAMARSKMAEDAPAPSATAETQTVHATASATVLLAP